KSIWGIGVDADQSYIGPQILTSALKKVDVAVFDTIKSAQDGSFKGGEDAVFDAQNGGVGIGKISSKVPADIVAKVRAQETKLSAGQIPGIPDEGEIRLKGRPVRFQSPKDAIEAGVGMVHQHFMLIPVMTVAENVVLGTEPRQGLLLDERKAAATVRELAGGFHFNVDPEAKV